MQRQAKSIAELKNNPAVKMNNLNVHIIEADLDDVEHCRAVPYLLNEYAKDLLGFNKEIGKFT